MFLPNPTIDLRFYSYSEAKDMEDKISAAAIEGVQNVTFSNHQEEYWPGKFSTISTVSIHMELTADLAHVRSELEKLVTD